MSDGEFTNAEEAAKLIRRARIKAREINTKIEASGGSYDKLIYDSYNAMFMAARAALHYLGVKSQSHRTVLAHYKHDIIEQGKVDEKYGNHLVKIQTYWEEEQQGIKHEIDPERAKRIYQATVELVDALAVVAGVIKAGPSRAATRELYSGGPPT